jgi:hypothetical protein
MSWFHRRTLPTPTVKTAIRVFAFYGDSWITPPSDGELTFSFANIELSTEAIAQAESLSRQIASYEQVALQYLRSDGEYASLVTNGKLKLEELDFTEILDKTFALTFGVEGEPDTTVTVEFRDGRPVEIWSAD